jgi:hypothetical protein
MKTETYDGRCKVTELVLVSYTVDFRPGMTFRETLKRFSDDYAGQCRRSYEAHNRCCLHLDAVKVVKIENGWR